MVRKYSRSASEDVVEGAMRKRKRGTLKRGKRGRGGKVSSRKQAIAIGLSEARKKGKKVEEAQVEALGLRPPFLFRHSCARFGISATGCEGERVTAGLQSRRKRTGHVTLFIVAQGRV